MLTAILTPTFLILYFSFLWSARSLVNLKRSVFFGIHLTEEQLEYPEVQRIIEGYKKKNKFFFILMAVAILLVVWPIPYFAINFSTMIIYTVVIMLFPFKWAVDSGEALKAIKTERGWYQKEMLTLKVDTEMAQRKMSAMPGFEWFVIPFMLIIAPAVFSWGDSMVRWILVSTGLLALICTYLLGHFFRKMRNEVYSNDTEVNYAYNHERKKDWSWFAIFLAITVALTNLAILAISLSSFNFTAFALVLVGTTVIPLLGYYILYKRQAKRLESLQNNASASQTFQTYAEDERYWFGGIFYNNPNNKKAFVTSASGTQSTVNMGTTLGKLYTYGTAAFVAILIVPLWLLVVVDEINPFSANIIDNEVRIANSLYRETFTVEDILSMELVDSAKLTFKRNGSGTARYAIGYFTSSEHGAVKVFIRSDSKPLIKIRLKDEVLLIALATKEKTLDFYSRIKQLK